MNLNESSPLLQKLELEIESRQKMINKNLLEKLNFKLLDKMTNILSEPDTHNRYYTKNNAYSVANLPKNKRSYKAKKLE